MTAHKYERLIERRFSVVSVSGDEYLCHCAFHEDTGKPNLYVNGVSGLFFCHVCGAKGKIDGDIDPDWQGLIERLSGSLEPPEPTYYGERWLRQFDFEHPYWEERGFSEQTIMRWQLGYDPSRDHCIVPSRDENGNIIGVIRRRLQVEPGEPRYLYPKGFPLTKMLFGAWRLGRKHNKVALVEGSLDAIKCWQSRVPAVALLGSRLSAAQHRLLHELNLHEVVIFTDNDRAGREAVEDIAEVVEGIGVSAVRYRPYWDAKDPGDLTGQQIRKAYHSARPLRIAD